MRLPKRVGLANAKIMSFTGRKVRSTRSHPSLVALLFNHTLPQYSAEDAAAIGLVDIVTEDSELGSVVAQLAVSAAVALSLLESAHPLV